MPNLTQIKADPSLVDQIKGCCGFAGALMALLVRKSDVVDEIADCASKGQEFKGIVKSTKVHARLLKRLRVGIIPGSKPYDFAMCLALMILFKEYSKQNGLTAWDECITYSTKWSAWRYANIDVTQSDTSLLRWLGGGDFTVTTTTRVSKLKDVPTDLSLSSGVSIQGASYKAGDLAVPADTMPALLGMLDLSVKRQGALIDNTSFAGFSGKKASAVKSNFQAFQDEIRTIQLAGNASSVDYTDVILGVGDRPGNSDFEAYNNVSHWVYVPVKPNNKPGSGEFKVWTWGAEHDFWSSITDIGGYFPAYAIYLS
jgi:hypothetical protein